MSPQAALQTRCDASEAALESATSQLMAAAAAGGGGGDGASAAGGRPFYPPRGFFRFARLL